MSTGSDSVTPDAAGQTVVARLGVAPAAAETSAALRELVDLLRKELPTLNASAWPGHPKERSTSKPATCSG